mgnify:CR=1 FL=1
MLKNHNTEPDEDAEDVATYDAIKARIARGEEEIFPAEIVNRIIDGKQRMALSSTRPIHTGEICARGFSSRSR